MPKASVAKIPTAPALSKRWLDLETTSNGRVLVPVSEIEMVNSSGPSRFEIRLTSGITIRTQIYTREDLIEMISHAEGSA